MWLLLKACCVKQQLADGMQGLFKGAQLALCRCWLGFCFWQWSKPPQAAGIISHGTGVQPWWIVTLWPFLDFPAEDSRHLPSLQQNLTCLSRHSFGTPIHIYLPYPHHPSPPFPALPSWPLGTMLPGCIRTDPKSVPFLDMAKYSPVLTDLMATTPTLTDRISIRPGK